MTAEPTTLLAEIEKDWARFQEVQTALRCSRSKVSKLIRDDVLKSRKLGREKWILRTSVKAYLDSIFNPVPPQPPVDGRRRKA